MYEDENWSQHVSSVRDVECYNKYLVILSCYESRMYRLWSDYEFSPEIEERYIRACNMKE